MTKRVRVAVVGCGLVSQYHLRAWQAAGAEIEISGALYADALLKCEAFQEQSGAIGIHAFDSALTVAGQGTLALEWQEQAADLDTVLVAVGGGGLISGLALGFEGPTKIIAVEPDGTRALNAALKAGRPTKVSVKSLAADSLGAERIGTLNYEICKDLVDQSVLVPDSAIREAVSLLWARFQIAAEPGGAAA
ncbi:MAG: pyridoxal-phosphate dependent enzyme, partial [Myxococcota bacterium]